LGINFLFILWVITWFLVKEGSEIQTWNWEFNNSGNQGEILSTFPDLIFIDIYLQCLI